MASIRQKDREVLIALAKSGCKYGDSLTDLAYSTGYSVQRLAAVAKRYSGQQLGRLKIEYLGPCDTSFKSHSPGIKNPRTGISERIPASICVEYRRKRRAS